MPIWAEGTDDDSWYEIESRDVGLDSVVVLSSWVY